MRAAVCRAYGRPDVVTVEDLPSPDVGPGQVRIRTAAAAVNFPDVLLVADRYQVSVPTPFVPGSELAGTVEEVAARRGQDGRRRGSGHGHGARRRVRRGGRRRRPTSTAPSRTGSTCGSAAAFGVAHRTATTSCARSPGVQPGEALVVLGAGGGVGLAAVQLGALLGAEVTAVASSAEKLAAAAECGATHVIDHRAGDLRAALRAALPDGADVVVDPVGGDLAEPALRSLRFGGRFVTVGYASGTIPRIPLNLVLLKGIEVLGFQFLTFAQHRPDELARNDDELDAMLADRSRSCPTSARASRSTRSPPPSASWPAARRSARSSSTSLPTLTTRRWRCTQ